MLILTPEAETFGDRLPEILAFVHCKSLITGDGETIFKLKSQDCPPIVIGNVTEPDVRNTLTSTEAPLSQDQITNAEQTLGGLDTGNNVWDQKEPQFVEYTAEQYQNEDVNDPLGRNSVIIKGPAGEVVGVIDSDGKVVQGDLEVQIGRAHV